MMIRDSAIILRPGPTLVHVGRPLAANADVDDDMLRRALLSLVSLAHAGPGPVSAG
ncbi:hypothetical protein ACF09J_28805 [Streptomyces sp. NPDC014889]|uniref:hypothetical protein n=1 Tax=Streptomyces sp. NPDC014889 TaxID=3364928 RepID=UPI0036F87192